jgi:hypothetical protein
VDQEQRFASACFLDLELSAVCGDMFHGAPSR